MAAAALQIAARIFAFARCTAVLVVFATVDAAIAAVATAAFTLAVERRALLFGRRVLRLASRAWRSQASRLQRRPRLVDGRSSRAPTPTHNQRAGERRAAAHVGAIAAMRVALSVGVAAVVSAAARRMAPRVQVECDRVLEAGCRRASQNRTPNAAKKPVVRSGNMQTREQPYEQQRRRPLQSSSLRHSASQMLADGIVAGDRSRGHSASNDRKTAKQNKIGGRRVACASPLTSVFGHDARRRSDFCVFRSCAVANAAHGRQQSIAAAAALADAPQRAAVEAAFSIAIRVDSTLRNASFGRRRRLNERPRLAGGAVPLRALRRRTAEAEPIIADLQFALHIFCCVFAFSGFDLAVFIGSKHAMLVSLTIVCIVGASAAHLRAQIVIVASCLNGAFCARACLMRVHLVARRRQPPPPPTRLCGDGRRCSARWLHAFAFARAPRDERQAPMAAAAATASGGTLQQFFSCRASQLKSGKFLACRSRLSTRHETANKLSS